MDIKEQIKKAVDSISKDKSLQEKFQKDPVKALEGILGVDLPDDVINQVVQGVKAKLTADNVSGAVDALKGFLKKIRASYRIAFVYTVLPAAQKMIGRLSRSRLEDWAEVYREMNKLWS